MPPKSINDFLPDAEQLLALEPEELAGLLLESLMYNFLSGHSNYLSRNQFLNQSNFSDSLSNYPDDIANALTEAWMWLEHEGLIAPRPRATGDRIFITRRGLKWANAAGVAENRKASLLPIGLLHPDIKKVHPAFLRGAYDTAVFEAFKEVEVAVRLKSGFSDGDVGVKLMRKAFAPDKPPSNAGPLTDTSTHIDEQEALAHLFAGAFGYFRNPTGHRNVTLLPDEAVEMIMFASHLLRIVDSR